MYFTVESLDVSRIKYNKAINNKNEYLSSTYVHSHVTCPKAFKHDTCFLAAHMLKVIKGKHEPHAKRLQY